MDGLIVTVPAWLPPTRFTVDPCPIESSDNEIENPIPMLAGHVAVLGAKSRAAANFQSIADSLGRII
jgi:hypothetical protein